MLALLGIIALTALSYASAGSAPYLGGDMTKYAEISKKSFLYPKSNKPITSKQIADYKRYQSKFSDIAKAYSEGYKAAIQAVQSRAVLAQKRLNNFKRSKIPQAPKQVITKSNVPNVGLFQQPNKNLVDVAGTEKSRIPHPSDLLVMNRRALLDQPKENGFHRGIPSILLSEEKRAEISRLNAAAMHRNPFMDSLGGNSYGGVGGVLSRQGWIYRKKHRRSLNDLIHHIVRQRRSHMPYLGQNLDRLGVVRVKPNWDAKPDKKNKLPLPDIKTPQSIGQQTSPKVASFVKQTNPYTRNNVPQPWLQKSNFPSFNPYYGQMSYNPFNALMFPQINSFNMAPVENVNHQTSAKSR